MSNLSPHGHTQETRTFEAGAAPDLHPEKRIEKNFYRNASNFRPTSSDESMLSMQRIKSTEDYIQTFLGVNYSNLFSDFVGDYVFSVWVSSDEADSPVFFVDNNIVASSLNLPFYLGCHFQYDINESYIGGEIFITNNETPALMFSIKDLLENTSTEKYFSEFIREPYELNIQAPIDRIYFKDLSEIGGTGGVLPGKHDYSMRYVANSGDKTLLSYPTPLISVPLHYVFNDADQEPNHLFPYLKTRGSDPTTIETPYGVKLRFRINNEFNYDYIEIVRTSYSSGGGMTYLPQSYIVKKIDIAPGEVSVREYVDCKANQDAPILLPDYQTQSYLALIKRCHSIRYHLNKVVQGNIEYESMLLDDVVVAGENAATPVMFPITTLLTSRLYPHLSGISETASQRGGYKLAKNACYRTGYMNNEKYGFGVMGFSGGLQRSFVKKIRGYEDYQMPNRRDEMQSYELDESYGAVTAATVGNVVGNTFEIFDLDAATKRNGDPDAGIVNITTEGAYRPRRPKNISEPNSTHNYRNIIQGDTISLAPAGYGLRYHATGISFSGIEDYPSWMKAFSVMRTKRAGRVVAQGLLTWSFVPPAEKKLYNGYFYSPDIESGIVSSEVLSNLINNPTQYKVKFESPLGFFTDILHASKNDVLNDYGSSMDIVQFARVLREIDSVAGKRINPGEAANSVGIASGSDGYVGFAKWRNTAHAPGDSFFASNDGNEMIDLVAFTPTANERLPFLFELELNDQLYKTAVPVGNDFLSNETFCEPVYVVSIIDTGAGISDENIQEYIPTDCYQKIQALIGITPQQNVGDIISFEIVDERPDDFYVIDGDTTTNKFIYLDYGDGILRRYININEKSAPDLITIGTDIADGTTIYCGEELYGTFRTSYDSSDDTYYIIFSIGTTQVEAGWKVYIVYDERFRLKIYGGDTYNGDCYFARLNQTTENLITLDTGFPYYNFDLNPSIAIGGIEPLPGTSIVIPSNSDMDFYRLRQICSAYPASSFTNLSFPNTEHYPLVNYIDRPSVYDPAETYEGNSVHSEYGEDFPEEKTRWIEGGIRFGQANINLDYSREQDYIKYFSQPTLGFEEETVFPSRVVWSLARSIGTQMSPSLRTIPYTNAYDIQDKRGGITVLCDIRTNGGSSKTRNLLAFTEEDVVELYTDKISVESADGTQLMLSGKTGFVPFISGEQTLGLPGCPEYFWRFFRTLNGAIYWADRNGFYRMKEEFARINGLYTSKILPILKSLPRTLTVEQRVTSYISTENEEYGFIVRASGYKDVLAIELATGIYEQTVPFANLKICVSSDVKQNAARITVTNIPQTGVYTGCVSNVGASEGITFTDIDGNVLFVLNAASTATYTVTNGSWAVVISAGLGTCGSCVELDIEECHVYSERNFAWIGAMNYLFDYVCSKDSKQIGFIEQSGKLLDQDSDTFFTDAYIDIVFNPASWALKEFVRFNVSANKIPQSIQFLDKDNNVLCSVLEANIREYRNGFEQFVPVKDSTLERLQDKVAIMRINYSTATGDVIVNSSSIQFRPIM